MDAEIVRLLLVAGADINARSGQGGTALHTAAFIGDAELVRYLLREGADRAPRTRDGKTPSDIARERGHEDVARLID